MTTPTLTGRQSPALNPALALTAIVVVAALLRLWKLDALGIISDEDISIMAVDGILEHGYPLLPSGMIYLRLGWFGYLVAAFSQFLGHGEFWLRLPAVLFNLAAIPLAYAFVSRLFSRPMGLVVAALVALSPAEIEIARLVRMYAPFAFFYLLTTLYVYRRYIDATTTSRALPLALALVTVVTHQLGFALAIVFLVPLLVKRQVPADRNWLIASSVVTGGFFLAWDTVIARFMSIHIPRVEPAADVVRESQGVLAPLIGPLAGILERFAAPSLAFVTDWLHSGSLPLLAGGAGLMLLAAGAVLYLHRREPRAVTAVALLCVGACALQQINVAVLAVLLYLVVANRGVQPLATLRGAALLATIGVSFVAWLAYAYYFTDPNAVAAAGISTHVRQSIRTLLDFPQYNVLWGLFFEMPLAAVPAVVGILWCIDGAARPVPDAPRAFLLYAMVLPLIVSGSVETTYRALRYVMHFDVFFLAFVALGVWHWRETLGALGFEPTLARGGAWLARAGTAALAAAAFAYVPGPVGAWVMVDRDHGAAEGLAAAFRLPFYPDFRTPAAYVDAHRDPAREPLIALQPREFYTYLHDVDYWLTTHAFEIENHAYAIAGERRDLYIDTPIISTMRELRAVIDESRGPVWLLAPATLVASRTTLTEDLASFIEGLDSEIVYTGLDHDMHVYRLADAP